MDLPPELCCPAHAESLSVRGQGQGSDPVHLECARGCRVPVVDGIPRFVPARSYAASFGLQWNAYARTQLDSYTGTTISRDRLARCLGGSLEVLAGRSVLEAGCGAGRFTEVLLAAGARVFALDLSSAVEANRRNCGGSPGYFVCQADLREIPARRAVFDVVLCLGVLQHTPRPEETIAGLASFVKPGGLLAVDHYSWGARNAALKRMAWRVHPRRLLREALIRLPPSVSMTVARGVSRTLLPLHRALWRPAPWARPVRRALRAASPLFDYYDSYPGLSRPLLEEWSFLDTHDGLTDRYKHFRSLEEVRDALLAAGLLDVEANYGGNGVEARGRRP